MAWAETVNPFFEPGVRIQTERGHYVIDTGPYAIIRHPGYFAAILLFTGVALSLGSWWALIPAGFAVAGGENRLGRPHSACGIARIRSLCAKSTFPIGSRCVVTLPLGPGHKIFARLNQNEQNLLDLAARR